ncbi:MAG TPA: YibE/F family protein [Firmicutes bacterium]|nr:YibE/F family protein [Bacillota bacterium]
MNKRANRARLCVGLFLLPVILILCAAGAGAAPDGTDEAIQLRGRVLSVENLEPGEELAGFVTTEQLARVEITAGKYKGEIYTLLNYLTDHPYFDIVLEPGDRVLLRGEVDAAGRLRAVELEDRIRDNYLYLLGGLFILLLVLIGRRKGLITVVTLGITVACVFGILLPLLLRGYAPIPLAVLVSAVVTFITLVALNGLQRKTFAALIGTVGGVLVAGLLAYFAGTAANLTGFSSEEAQMLQFMELGTIDVRGLLFAGIIIGALGAVMDVAMSIAAASHEISLNAPGISVRQLIRSALNVGTDVMGTMANTLILAYVGASLPLMLLFLGMDTPLLSIVNRDLVATEVIRAMAGSIGIIAAVPLTAITSGLLRSAAAETAQALNQEIKKEG